MTQQQLTRRINWAREPWREYFAYRPDDMPPKRGNPEKLLKLLSECGEVDEQLLG
jgi:hypothetical protein